MLARYLHPQLCHHEDALAVERIRAGPGIVDVNKDAIFFTGKRGEPGGYLVFRPGAFVHELECGSDALRLMRAEALTNYAIGHARANGLQTAIFLVRGDNAAMHHFVRRLGAVRQTEPGDVLYTLTPE